MIVKKLSHNTKKKWQDLIDGSVKNAKIYSTRTEYTIGVLIRGHKFKPRHT